jgi:Lon protease-like protein
VPVELPLFPLNAVLFPHVPMALHIFEDRYRALMRDCQAAGTTFGVLAIRSGREVGDGAQPYSVGTLAQLRNVEELPDGRFNLVVVGASRFHVDAFSYERPYLIGEVRYLEDHGATVEEAEQLMPRVVAAFRDYLAATQRLSGAEPEEVSLPGEPELLSYLVAASMQVETARRQALLELDSTAARLRGCLTLLRREALLINEMLDRQDRRREAAPLN